MAEHRVRMGVDEKRKQNFNLKTKLGVVRVDGRIMLKRSVNETGFEDVNILYLTQDSGSFM